MLDKMLSGTGVSASDKCDHVIDEKVLPEWNKRVGKVYKCTLCGSKVFKEKFHNPMPGKRIHLSKKERRRRKKEFEASSGKV